VPRVIVVGAGPGGLAAAARLLERGGDAVDVTLIAPGGTATFLAGTLDVMLADAPPGSFSCAVAMSGVSLIDARVDAISPEGVVAVAGDRIRADAVIAAPGLQLRSREHVPPWPRAVSAWDPLGAAAARAAILGVAAGRVLVAACGLPYRCPPAPFALAVGLADRHLRARHQTRVTVATPEPMPLAGVGGEAPALIMDATAGAGVTVERGFVVELDHSEDGILRSADGRELRYDAAFLVPVHERSPCLAGLPGDGPLVPVGVSGRVGESRVFVVGDAAATGLPRAAGVARATATAAADAALAALGVCDAPEPAPIHASCFMFHHGGAVSRIRVTFRDGAGDVAIDGPSLDLLPARAGELRRFLEVGAR
jgi:sulfide:quinone oxidoreductase